jgi:hypothetical protein
MPPADSRVAAWSDCFRRNPLSRALVTSLEDRAPEIWRRTFDLLRQESPEYRNAVDDEFTAESKAHCGELLDSIISIAGGKLHRADPFAFVRKHAEWRARHQVPLVASLHAYRLAHKTYWGITRERLANHRNRKDAMRALEMLSDFWIELFETVGAVLEEAHAAEQARAVARNSEAQARLLDDDLLAGTEPARPESRQLLALFGIRSGQKMAVAVARPFADDGHRHQDVEVSSRSLLRLFDQTFPPSIPGKLLGLRNGELIVLAGGDGDPSRRLAKYMGRLGIGRRGTASYAGGVGLDKGDVAQIPESLAEARMALELASHDRALLHFADIGLTDFVVECADRSALRLVPEWVRETYSSDRHHDLLRTVRAFADASLNVKETARRLAVHPNTVYFRLNQIEKCTGVNPRNFTGISTLMMALRLLDKYCRELA